MRHVQRAGVQLMMRRLALGLSASELGRRAGVDHSAVVRAESGNDRIAYETIAVVAEALGLDATPRPALSVLWTSGQRGAYREVLNHLDTLRIEAEEAREQVSLRVSPRRDFWRKLWSLTGPVLDTINQAASAYGYQLALVRRQEVTDGNDDH